MSDIDLQFETNLEDEQIETLNSMCCPYCEFWENQLDYLGPEMFDHGWRSRYKCRTCKREFVRTRVYDDQGVVRILGWQEA